MKCPKCEAKNRKTAVFCAKCGEPLSAQKTENIEEKPLRYADSKYIVSNQFSWNPDLWKNATDTGEHWVNIGAFSDCIYTCQQCGHQFPFTQPNDNEEYKGTYICNVWCPECRTPTNIEQYVNSLLYPEKKDHNMTILLVVFLGIPLIFLVLLAKELYKSGGIKSVLMGLGALVILGVFGLLFGFSKVVFQNKDITVEQNTKTEEYSIRETTDEERDKL